jgi:protein-S-isoprenylcysteine O-methyltransferase Ste14
MKKKPTSKKQADDRFLFFTIIVPLSAILIQAIAFFLAAGRVDVPYGWAFIVIATCFVIVCTGFFASDASNLMEAAKAQIKKAANESFIPILIASVSWIAILIAGGIEARFTPVAEADGDAIRISALFLLLCGMILLAETLMHRPIIGKLATAKRNEPVSVTGPYRFVRHPGIAGCIVCAIALALLFTSLWAGLPAMIFIACLLRVMHMKDREMIRRGAYKRYASEVRYRILPGII